MNVSVLLCQFRAEGQFNMHLTWKDLGHPGVYRGHQILETESVPHASYIILINWLKLLHYNSDGRLSNAFPEIARFLRRALCMSCGMIEITVDLLGYQDSIQPRSTVLCRRYMYSLLRIPFFREPSKR